MTIFLGHTCGTQSHATPVDCMLSHVVASHTYGEDGLNKSKPAWPRVEFSELLRVMTKMISVALLLYPGLGRALTKNNGTWTALFPHYVNVVN